MINKTQNLDRPVPFSPAAERNREPILAALKHVLPPSGRIVEIGSGTAQHVRFFADALQQWQWQPSELANNLQTLNDALPALTRPDNVQPPIELNVAKAWPEQTFDAVYSANTSHIMSWSEVEAMFTGVSSVLTREGLFILYGPFRISGQPFADSNHQFDLSLRQRDPLMGIRDLDALDRLAETLQLKRMAEFAMPANNHLLMFKKTSSTK